MFEGITLFSLPVLEASQTLSTTNPLCTRCSMFQCPKIPKAEKEFGDNTQIRETLNCVKTKTRYLEANLLKYSKK